MSNIFIGFCDAFKVSRRIPLRRRIKAPRFSFSAFALVLERLRTVQKRILAGSTAGHVAKDVRTSWPKYFYQAENLGYTMNVFNRVQKLDTKQRGRKSPVDPFSDSTADSTGDDGIAPAYDVRTGEQGVDENLHLNMMDSMWDCKAQPGTIVLATGDAAEAEFSPGFFQYAIRALDAGWMLELVTWKRAISSAWKTPEFTKKYAGKFRIIYLDDFLEELQMVDLF
ncbi:hypothetical protein M426DRAFT_68034 [Hypoxylon sp. CI-4A]|nr:hypothetical protein M426DRAFT_68034 [Hypoxylon sp. CI-4A]